jgi:chromosome partitioning protein
MIIAFLNQKGGVGKTTLAMHLAAELSCSRYQVMVIDADPQGSALDWSQARQRAGLPRLFGVVGIPRETLHQEVPAIARIVDHVVIDGPPRVTALARSAILAADVVLIPVQPSPYDVWACTDIVSLVREAMIYGSVEF